MSRRKIVNHIHFPNVLYHAILRNEPNCAGIYIHLLESGEIVVYCVLSSVVLYCVYSPVILERMLGSPVLAARSIESAGTDTMLLFMTATLTYCFGVESTAKSHETISLKASWKRSGREDGGGGEGRG